MPIADFGASSSISKFESFQAAWSNVYQVWTTGCRLNSSMAAMIAVALVLVVARQGNPSAGLGRQVRGRSCLSPECRASHRRRRSPPHRSVLVLLPFSLLDELHFAIDTQNLRHLLLELRIAAFQVAPPSDHRPTPARRSAGPSDDAPPKRAPPQRTSGPPGTPTASAPARPGSPAPFASGQSKLASPNPPRQLPTRSLDATPP